MTENANVDAVNRTATMSYPGRLLLAGLGLGVAFDLLFNGHMPGVSLVLFTVLLLGGLALALSWEAARPLRANLWLPVALLFFSAMGMVRANGFLMLLNISAALLIASLLAILLAQRRAAEMGLPALGAAPVEALAASLGRAGQALAEVLRGDLGAKARPARRQAVPVLTGLLLAVPVVLLFTALLASADLIFGEWVRWILSLRFLDEIGRWIGHVAVALSAGLLLAGGLAYAARRGAPHWSERLGSVRWPWFQGITESMVVVNAVNLLFFLFMLIQIPYLFGGQANVHPGRFTYAEYARRGFGELVVVAVLTLGLLVALGTLTRRQSRSQRRAFNISGTVLLALTGVLLVSAFKRLTLYELAYGYTQMRIYPHVFMVWLGLLLAWFAVTLWRRPDRFAIGLLVAGLGFVVTLDVINPDALIVRLNFRRSQELVAARAPDRSSAVDACYLGGLSEDAVPALMTVADQVSGITREKIEQGLRWQAAQSQVETRQAAWNGWPSFHLSRHRAYRLLLDRYGAVDFKEVKDVCSTSK